MASAFTRVLGRPIVARPALLFAVLPLPARKGGYISRDTQKQKDLFGQTPTIDDAVAGIRRDKGLT
jgi:hypothetical protein